MGVQIVQRSPRHPGRDGTHAQAQEKTDSGGGRRREPHRGRIVLFPGRLIPHREGQPPLHGPLRKICDRTAWFAWGIKALGVCRTDGPNRAAGGIEFPARRGLLFMEGSKPSEVLLWNCLLDGGAYGRPVIASRSLYRLATLGWPFLGPPLCSSKSINQLASRLMADVNIQSRIAELRAPVIKKAQLTFERWVQEAIACALNDPRKYFDAQCNPLEIKVLHDECASALVGFSSDLL